MRGAESQRQQKTGGKRSLLEEVKQQGLGSSRGTAAL